MPAHVTGDSRGTVKRRKEATPSLKLSAMGIATAQYGFGAFCLDVRTLTSCQLMGFSVLNH